MPESFFQGIPVISESRAREGRAFPAPSACAQSAQSTRIARRESRASPAARMGMAAKLARICAPFFGVAFMAGLFIACYTFCSGADLRPRERREGSSREPLPANARESKAQKEHFGAWHSSISTPSTDGCWARLQGGGDGIFPADGGDDGVHDGGHGIRAAFGHGRFLWARAWRAALRESGGAYFLRPRAPRSAATFSA